MVVVIRARFLLECFSTRLKYHSVIFWMLIVLGSGSLSWADRTFTKVYEPILESIACFKRLNGTHEIGCRSSTNGDVGVLHVVDDTTSLQWVLQEGPHNPYIAVLYPEDFTRDNLIKFRKSERVSGILLLPERNFTNNKLSAFSTDSSCPNQDFSFYNNKSEKVCQKWNDNEPRNGLLFENFDFPIFYVTNQTEADTIVKCYETFNKPTKAVARDWPLCAAQMQSFMFAAVDTPTCMRRSNVISISRNNRVCDPLGDLNLWATLFPRPKNETVNKQPAIVVAARLDGASFFDQLSPSADSSVTALVTLLSVIKQLGSLKDRLSSLESKNIYFIIFNGESFGYIGSSRVVYDMKNGHFPLKLDEIEYYLEINQVAGRGSNSYYIHQSEVASKELTDILIKQGSQQNLDIKISQSQWGVPPSSLHSFLRERPNITGVVLTNHEESYKNKFYNDVFDSKVNIGYRYGDTNANSTQQQLASLSAAISNTLLSLLNLGDNPVEPVSPDLESIDELLHCFLVTSNCSILQDISGVILPSDAPAKPFPLYVGVATYPNTLTTWLKYLLVTYLGTKMENVTTDTDCWKVNTSGPHYFINKTCWDCSQVNLTEAMSPAFLIPDYDWSSGKYSTWSESVWQKKFSVRIFLRPSLLHEVLTLVSGIVVLVASMLFMRFVNERKDAMFPSRLEMNYLKALAQKRMRWFARDCWQIRYPWWTFAGTVKVTVIQLEAALFFFKAVPQVFSNLYIFKNLAHRAKLS